MQGTLKFSDLSFLNAFFPLRSDGRKGENLPVKSISPNSDGLKTSPGIHLLFVRTLQYQAPLRYQRKVLLPTLYIQEL